MPAMADTPSGRRGRGVAVVAVIVAFVVIVAAIAIWQLGPDGSGRSGRDVVPDVDVPASSVKVDAEAGAEVDCPEAWVDRDRACRWVIPESDPARPMAAVVLLHGLDASPARMIAEGGWQEAANEHSLVVVAPGGTDLSWNAGLCCAEARGNGVDDAAYLTDLIDGVGALDQVDSERIFVVGFSNGGLMGYKLLCSAGDRIAKFVSVAGTDVAGCPASEPVSTLQFHGTADEVVPYSGGVSLQALLNGVQFPPVTATFKKMVIEQNCDDEPALSSEPLWDSTLYEGCDGGTTLEIRTVEGATHRYEMLRGAEMTDVILDYFGVA